MKTINEIEYELNFRKNFEELYLKTFETEKEIEEILNYEITLSTMLLETCELYKKHFNGKKTELREIQKLILQNMVLKILFKMMKSNEKFVKLMLENMESHLHYKIKKYLENNNDHLLVIKFINFQVVKKF